MSQHQPNQPKKEILKNIAIFLAGAGMTVATYFVKPHMDNMVKNLQQDSKIEKLKQQNQIKQIEIENFEKLYPELVLLVKEQNGTFAIENGNVVLTVRENRSVLEDNKNIELSQKTKKELTKLGFTIETINSNFAIQQTSPITYQQYTIITLKPQNNFHEDNREDGRGFFDDQNNPTNPNSPL